MNRSTKAGLLASVAFFISNPVLAQTSLESLEKRIADMEAVITHLSQELAQEKRERAQLEAQASDTAQKLQAVDNQIIEIDTTLAHVDKRVASVGKIAQKKGFKLGDTVLKAGGFIDFDAHMTRFADGTIAGSSAARDFYIPSTTPVGGDNTSLMDFTAQGSRFFVQGKRDVDGKTLTAHIELDFLATSQGNERVSSSFSPRLRRAYVDYGNWRVGQEWSTFQNTSAIPESASFLALSEGQAFVRQPMIRYTTGALQFALENPNTTVTNAGGGSIESDTSFVPDVVARYNWKGDFGNVSLSAIARQLRLDQGTTEDEILGYGVNAAGRLKLAGKDDLRFSLIAGEGVGRYAALNAFDAAALDPSTGDLEAIPVYGGLAAWRHSLGGTARVNVGYSSMVADNPNFVVDSEPRAIQSAYTALLWDPLPKFTIGAEVMVGQRELESGDSGKMERLTFSTKYAF